MLSFRRGIGFFRNLVEAQVAEDHFSFEQVSCSPPSGGCFWYRVPSKEQGKGPPQRSLSHKGKLPPQRSGLPCRRRDNQVINLIEVRSFRRASENASHLVVRSTGKRVVVAFERPVYPRTGQRQVAAAAEPGTQRQVAAAVEQAAISQAR